MRFPRFAFGALLLGSPLLSRAQTTDAAPAPLPGTPRFYVGLAAYHSNYQNLASWRQGDTGFRVPAQLTAGYQLRPRLALELGVAYSGRTATNAYDGYLIDEYGTIATEYRYRNTTTARTSAVSALARYALTRQPDHRLQLAVLGGGTLLHESFYSRGSQSYGAAGSFQTTPYAVRDSFNNLLLMAGLGLRYRLSPRFGLNFDLATNYNLTRPTTFNDGFSGSAALGLRYWFGV